MRIYLLAAVAAAAIATPAVARDGTPYVGIEGGFLLPQDLDQNVTLTSGTTTDRFKDGFTVEFKHGYDVDGLAGYDFGRFRVEGELGYKRLRLNNARFNPGLASDLGLVGDDFDISSRGSVVSLMANALIDFGDDNGWSGYIGGGAGRARVRLAGDRDGAYAYQAIAGVRKAISPNIDVGLKYRYFMTSKVNFNDEFSDSAGTIGLNSSGKLRTHSLLASLIFNFAAPAPVIVEPVIAPPPPPAPATQTCYDGSVILATDACPQPPVETPPAPPEAIPERG